MTRRSSSEEPFWDGPFDAAPDETPETSAGIKDFVDKLGFRGAAVAAPAVVDASGLPVDSDAPQRRRPSHSIADAAADLIASFEKAALKEAAADGEAMLQAWPEVAGPLADRVRPERFISGTLFAAVATNAELFEIRRFKLRGLLAKAKRHPAFAGIAKISLRVAGRAERDPGS